MSDITDLIVNIYNATNWIKMLIKPVLAAGNLISGSLRCYQCYSESSVVSEQMNMYTLTPGM